MFRQNLRRNLLEACDRRAHSGRSYRVALAAVSSLCVLLTGLVVLFVSRPAYPLQLHALLLSEEGIRADEGALATNQALATDQAFVRQWADQVHTAQPVTVQPVDHVKTYRVSRFQLDDGRQVDVFTLVPDEIRAKEEVY